MDNPLLTVIIVNYKTEKYIDKCLESIYESTKDTSSEIIVIDNNSKNGTVDYLKKHHSRCKIIENHINVGYAKAVNQGIKASSGKYILFLNADIVVLDESFNRLIEFMENNPQAGVVGCKLLNPDRSLQFSCRTYYDFKTIFLNRIIFFKEKFKSVRHHLMLDWDHNSVREVDWMIGASLLVRRDVFSSVGFLDERFFLYFEDVDFCFRVKNSPWKVLYFPFAEMVHYYQRLSRKNFYFNKYFFIHVYSFFKFRNKWRISFIKDLKRKIFQKR